MVQTVDFFTPVVDDPFLFGQIAAANALSDVYAMGARPVLALALVAFPTAELPVEMLEEILRGGAEKVAEAGAVIGGGHSIDHDIPLYGLAVTGLAAESRDHANAGAKPGDALVLTKPLGIGVTVCAGRADALAAGGRRRGSSAGALLADAALDEAIAVMAALNRARRRGDGGLRHPRRDRRHGLRPPRARPRDDGGVGHDRGVLRRRDPAALRGAPARRRAGSRPTAPASNVRNLRPRTEVGAGVSDDDLLLLCDAQTSGGLLVSASRERREAYAYARACRERGAEAAASSAGCVGRAAALLRVEKRGRPGSSRRPLDGRGDGATGGRKTRSDGASRNRREEERWRSETKNGSRWRRRGRTRKRC